MSFYTDYHPCPYSPKNMNPDAVLILSTVTASMKMDMDFFSYFSLP